MYVNRESSKLTDSQPPRCTT